MELEEAIAKAIEAYNSVERKYLGEFALFYYDADNGWRADIGNTCRHVNLGESVGEFSGEGPTPIAAVEALIAEVMR